MDRLTEIFQLVTGNDALVVGEHTPLKQIDGWDSMRAVNFQMELEQEFGVDLSDQQITGNSTLADLKNTLRSKSVNI